jgi:hypothetical protein
MSNARFGLRTRTGQVSDIVQNSPFTSVLLDTFPNAAAAYSLRLLRSAYTGSAIRVRRSNDNAEQDIGFDTSGNLDTSALTSFVGANNGFVVTWYDQSGNGRNATQAIAGSQPQIVSSGNVILDNGKPSLAFNGSRMLIYSGLVYATNTVFATAVFSLNNSVDFGVIASQNTGGTGRSNILSIDNSIPKKSVYFFNNGTSYSNLSSGTITDNTQTLMTNYSFNNDYYNALNGSSGNNNISGQPFTPVSSNGFGIGGQLNFFNQLTGKIQEINIWNSDQSIIKTFIEANINDYYAIY